MKSKLKVIAYLCIIVILIIITFLWTNQKNQIFPQPRAEETKQETMNNPQIPISQSASVDSAEPQKNEPTKVNQYDEPMKDPISPDMKSEIDKEQFKEITQKTTKEIYEKMRVDEIKSLKESIVNDKKLLKKIEDSGTGIEDYKFIQQNLKKRIDRLKLLESKK
jgi:hypothetical protein